METAKPLPASAPLPPSALRPSAGRPWLRVFYVVFCILATLQFLRSYFVVDTPYLDAARYEAGSERTPYQSRILMSVVMRHAEHSHLIARMAGRMRGTLSSPATFSVFLVDLGSLAAIALLVWLLYRRASPSGRLAWLPYPLALAIMAETYIVRFQQAIYFPYDLLSAALFTLCLYLVYTRRYLLLLPAFVLGCYTRETIVLIILFVLLNIETLPRLTRAAWREIACAGALAAIWIPIYLHLNHLYRGNPTESFSRVAANLHTLSNPMQWSQVASAGGFLLLVPLLFWKVLPDLQLRRYTLIIPIWIFFIFAVGMINETRVFGELTGLLAVNCVVLFESLYVPVSRH